MIGYAHFTDKEEELEEGDELGMLQLYTIYETLFTIYKNFVFYTKTTPLLL